MDHNLFHVEGSMSHMRFHYMIFNHDILILKFVNIIFIMSSISQLFFVKNLTHHMSFCKLFQLNSLIHCAILHMVVTFQFDYLQFISM